MNDVGKPGILIVDDDYAIRDSLSQILEEEGYSVEGAANGQEALECMRTASVLPCVILLDLSMPVMDGWAFRAEQKKNPRLGAVPVIILTADGRANQKAQQLEVQAFLEKPLKASLLLEVVGRYCS